MISKPNQIIIALLFLLTSLLLDCAKEGMPPGGPEDTVSPEVVSVSPSPDATQVDPNSRIEITFSERMIAKITEESIFISPLPREPFEFKWKGRKLVLIPSQPLQPDRTYVISIGTDALDLRRNRLTQSYTFAFSTGSRLDHGSISGEVWSKREIGLQKEVGTSIWAYLLAEGNSSVDPEKDKPDYVTQTDNEGKYSLENLSLGTYRLFAVQDQNRNLLWEWEQEAIGVTTKDVELLHQDATKTHIDFVLDKKDKSRLSLTRCLSLNRNLVKLEFDEDTEDNSALDLTNYRITSLATQTTLRIKSVFFQKPDSRSIFLVTEPMTSSEEYTVELFEITDKAGNPLDTLSNTCRFEGTDIPDTIGPMITDIKPKDGATNVFLDLKIDLHFDEPPQQQSVQSSFSLVDSNQVEVKGKGSWSAPNTFVFSPDSLLSANTRYQIKLSGWKVTDLLNNPAAIDSSLVSGFETLDPDEAGSISGLVRLMEKQEQKAIILTLWPMEEEDLPLDIILPQSGPFLFQRVLPGKYLLGGYVDLDGNKSLSTGYPKPFTYLEPFAFYPDTIRVRSRWETEGVELIIY
jgi:hypothetical protein